MKKIFPTLSLISAGLAAMVFAPLAAAHSYSYVEGGYVSRDTHGVNDDGIRLGVSGSVARNVALIGEYATTGDYDQLSAGAIYHQPIDRALDVFGGATLEQADNGHDDDTGFGLRAGLRWSFAQHFELSPEIRHTNLFDNSDTSLRLTGLFNFAPNWNAQAALQSGDDDRFEAGLRYNFGR
ncbi:hypothetical protein E4T66_01675 [Sinimarinibacterium sp. CAU 1509]|uniref:outer membrane beta-barrel protein n=1 Tax=Sinimarinibacterium sp. CAU 1509 TaxID=2562283 RepID=UPI0010AD71CB|nr:outer membrane beta-barrel protein [Sinimarinibacterium sp. CAU 1509]TJY64961.1 hypothetical protein E4T66_01675 [Sinimarinibacterium sp. CAU 1509]